MRKILLTTVILLVLSLSVLVATSCDLFGDKNPSNTDGGESTFNIIYETNGGMNPDTNPTTGKETSEPLALSDAIRSDYIFGGWYRDTEFLTARVTVIPTGTTSDVYLYAKWTPREYTLRLNYGNGKVTEEKFTVESEITLPIEDRQYYDFVGWYESENFSSTPLTSLVKASGDKTLYARYTLTTYTVSFVVMSGTAIDPIQFNVTTDSFDLPQAERPNTYFVGWYDNSDYSGAPITTIESGTAQSYRLYARFVEYYTVVFTLYNGSMPSFDEKYQTAASNVIRITALDTLILPDSTLEGYEFVGWYLESLDENGAIKYQMTDFGRTIVYDDTKLVDRITPTTIASLLRSNTSSVYLYARWQTPSVVVRFNSKGGSPILDAYSNVGNEIQNPIPAMTGYYFDGWYDNEELSGTAVADATDATFICPASSVTLYAAWRIRSSYITYQAVGGDEMTPTLVEYGKAFSSLDLPTPNRRGYSFDGYFTQYASGIYEGEYPLLSYVADSTAVIGEELATNGITLFCKWEKETYSIEYVLPEGAINNERNVEEYTIDVASVTLYDPSWSDGEFVGWYLFSDYSGTVQRTIYFGEGELENIILYARFNRKYSVEFRTLSIPYTMSTRYLEYFADGRNISLSSYIPTPTLGSYVFDGWYDNDNYRGDPITEIICSSAKDYFLYPKFTASYAIEYYVDGMKYTGNALPSYYVTNRRTLIPAPEPIINKNFYGWYYDNAAKRPLEYDESSGQFVLDVSGSVRFTLYSLFYDCPQGLVFTLQSDETYSVTSYGSNIAVVNIPPYYERKAVTEIANEAFKNNTVITTLKVNGNNLKKIGKSAFEGCSELTTVTLPSELNSFGEAAFKSTSIASISIPAEITELSASIFEAASKLSQVTFLANNKLLKVGVSAFEGCSLLAEIALPSSVTAIEEKAFRRCTNLTTVSTQLTSLDFIGNYAFAETKLTSISLPQTLVKLGKYVFYTASTTTPFHSSLIADNDITYINQTLYYVKNVATITSFTFEENTKGIAGGVFTDASLLTSITLPDTLQFIGDSAFSGAGIASITIPVTVTRIDAEAFRRCSALNEVNMLSELPPVLNSDTVFPNPQLSPTFRIYVSDMAAYITADYWIKLAQSGILQSTGA